MSAISTTLWAYLKPNDVLLMSEPLYGGTETLIDKTMPAFGIGAVARGGRHQPRSGHGRREGRRGEGEGQGRQGRVVSHRNTGQSHQQPGGPASSGAKSSEWIAGQQGGARPPVAVDNTFLGPVFQKPLEHGADLVMYSLTKYVGGHSDLVAGGVIGSKAMVAPVRALRSSLGTQLDPNTSWMIMRSMETLALRMRASADNAGRVAGYLAQHPKVASVNYLGHLKSGDPRAAVFERQCQSAGPRSRFPFAVARPKPSACWTRCR